MCVLNLCRRSIQAATLSIRQDGRGVQQNPRVADGYMGTTPLTKQHMVPYNRLPSLRSNCHINLEVCIGFRAVQYLYE